MYPKKNQQIPRRAVCLLASFVFFAFPAIGFAQGAWEVPDGTEADPLQPPYDFPGLTGAPIGPITFTEAEFPLSTQIDGLVVTTLNGIPLPGPLSFGFEVGGVPSTDCTVNLGPPPQTYVDPPGIEGDVTGTLSVDFGVNVSSVEFGFALACIPPAISPGATVTAFDANMNMIGMTSVDAIDTGNIFVENLVTFAPGTFRSIEVTFGNPVCGRFLFDNLSYEEVQFVPPTEIPTLSTLGLVGLGVVLLLSALFVVRRRAARA